MAKICKACGVAKPVEEYYKHKNSLDGLYTTCKACFIERQRWINIKNLYGLSKEDYENVLQSQHYGCKICGQQCSQNVHLAVDHCHKTGQVRGLLCGKCNKGIGFFDDDVNRMRSAMQYLTCSGEWLPVTTVGSLVSQG